MQRYLIMGSCMEYMAHLCIDAEGEPQALQKWQESFPSCPKETFSPKVYIANGEETFRYYNGGYNYDN